MNRPKQPSTQNFVIGQRWISNTQAELGLGMVTQVDHRFVTLSFPAAGEQRIYAMDNAPLSRVIYRVGDQVNNIDDETMEIHSISDSDGYLTYEGQHLATGGVISWGEVELDCFVQFNQPQERLFAGQIDRLDEFQLRYQALEHAQSIASNDVVSGLIGPRVQLLPHQFFIASEVGKRIAPRVLLADEVGLGKTIEAGMIIHRHLLLGTSQRILVLVPETLIHQWLVEMLRRFNLSFTLLNEERLTCDEEAAEHNAFEDSQLVLCSLQTLVNNEDHLANALACEWDMLVVDEAHHLQWDPAGSSPEYSTVEHLARLAKGLLLLTATPEQLGMASHFARLRLLDPDRYFDYDQFLDEQKHYQDINLLLQQLETLSSAEELSQQAGLLDQLQTLLGDQLDQYLAQKDAINLIVEQLLDCHGTGRVLFRNTRAAVQGFPSRVLHQHPVEPKVAHTLSEDTKVKWLSEWLKENRKQKVLLICAEADRAIDLELHLSLRCGVRSAVFHEGLSLIERDRAAAYFADMEDGAQILVCSEIGSEGRNFQFAHHLVLFDLPENPDLLEQRIGRLDRIGQTSDVNIHVPYIEGSPEHARLRWFHEGLNALESVCPVGHQVYEQLGERMQSSLTAEADLQPLLNETAELTQSLLENLRQGRDKLLELNSCRKPVADKLIRHMEDQADPMVLSEFMETAFDVYGVDSEKLDERTIVIRPSDHMRTEHFPGLQEDGVSATYSRELALSRDDMQFLTWEHPMVQGVIDMLISSEMGNTTLCTIRLKALKPGTMMLESAFRVTCPAPRHLQLNRYLDGHIIRLLSDSEKRNLESVISSDHLRQLAQPVKKAMAKQLMQQARNAVEDVLQHLEARAEQNLPAMVAEATERMHNHYQSEVARLETLAKRNPNIRDEEINQLREWERECRDALQHATLRLEALRVIIVID